jgi:hypothetical protein
LIAARSGIAASVSLPFFEGFDTPTADAVTTYPEFTADDGGSGVIPVRYVNSSRILRFGSGGFPFYPAFSVTPNPTPTGEIIITVDMGWNGIDNDPPVGIGFGGTGLRLGDKIVSGHVESESLFGFHPGYPGGALRVEGPGGFGSTDMGFTTGLSVLDHVEIHSFPSGLFTIKITDGANPANVFTTSFTDPAAYGGSIGLLAFAGGSAIYDNLSITAAAVPEPASAALLGLMVAGIALRRGRGERR